MFIVALGIVMLQLVANPYVMVLGSPEKGAFRMTFSQALNSVATTVAPIFILNVILGGKQASDATPADIPYPYLGLGIFTLVLCIILYFLKLPNINEGEQAAESTGVQKEYKSSVFKYPHVWFGALGIFMYMGLEIGVPSMLAAYFEAHKEILNGENATNYLPLYWGGMMVGRFIGAGILSKFQPRTLLSVCLIAGAVCVGLSFFLNGFAAVYAMLAAGLFHSVMWPLVFNLGLQDLGPHTKAASGIINLGVVGAAILTPLMGSVVDNPALGVGTAICMMFIYYAYVMWFCWKGSRVGLD
jgi:FHS family L-fucose permease-like MFS transporter